jgi:hypothetical protein
MSQREDAMGHTQYVFKMGSPNPWFSVETYPVEETPYRSSLNPSATSLGWLVGGLLTAWMIWILEKAQKPNPSKWYSPVAFSLVWAAFILIGSVSGLYMGNEAVKQSFQSSTKNAIPLP